MRLHGCDVNSKRNVHRVLKIPALLACPYLDLWHAKLADPWQSISAVGCDLLCACKQGMGQALRMMSTQSLYGMGKPDFPETPGTDCQIGHQASLVRISF